MKTRERNVVSLDRIEAMIALSRNMLSRYDGELEIAFDMRGMDEVETVTQLLSVQVTVQIGQGPIVHSSAFIQIVVVPNEIQVANKNDSQTFYKGEYI